MPRFRIILVTLLALCAAFLSRPGGAFSAKGHRVIVTIADGELTTHARQKVGEILAGRSMADVCMWADEERRNDRSIAPWHYIDYEISDGKVLAGSDTSGTIVDAISSQSAILVTSHVPNQRARALMFIVHFLGDLHQPLHCSDNHDQGGNKVRVAVLGQEASLHRTWDGILPDHMLGPDTTTGTVGCAALSIANEYRSTREALTSGTVEDWSRDSFRVAKDAVYRFRPPDDPAQPVLLDDDYVARSGPVIRWQFAAAGFRLAAVLNRLLDPESQPKAVPVGK